MRRLVGAVLTALLLSSLAAAGNLVRNPGFETVDDEDMPENWAERFWTRETLGETTTQRGSVSGQRCLRVALNAGKGVYGCFSRAIDVSRADGRRLLFSCNYRTMGDPFCQAMVVFFDTDFMENQWMTRPLSEQSRQLRASAAWKRSSWHAEVPPNAKQAVVVFQMLQAGALLVDDVVLRPAPDVLSWEQFDIGRVAALPSLRRATFRMTSNAPGLTKARVELTAYREGRSLGKAIKVLSLESGMPQTVDLRYSCPASDPHEVSLDVFDQDSEELGLHRTQDVPGMVDATLDVPSFRGTIRNTDMTPNILVSGRLFAVPGILGQTVLSARLQATGAEATEGKGITRLADGSFTLTLPTEGILIGQHHVKLEARQGARVVARASLPVRRIKASGNQVSYDVDHRLWIGDKQAFPVGIYYVMTTEELELVHEAGLNLVVVPSPKASYVLAENAAAKGVGLVISSPSTRQDFWQRRQEKFTGISSFVGWEVVQRPDAKIVHPDIMLGLYQMLSEVSPDHPIATTLRHTESMAEYARATDIIIPWEQPIPQMPLTRVAEMVDAARAATENRKPVWAMIQTAGKAWSADRTMDEELAGRKPTPDELRAMSYLALVHGADGLLYYAYRIASSDTQRHFHLPVDAPELWTAMSKVAREIQALSPVIAAGTRRMVLTPDGDGPVHLAMWKGVERSYVIGVNTAQMPSITSFSIPDADATGLSLPLEDRRVTTGKPGVFCDTFKPYEVHVYELPATDGGGA